MPADMMSFDLVDAKKSQDLILRACVKQWFRDGPHGLKNYADCSGFVESVQNELHLQPFKGDANSIFEELNRRSDWITLGIGSDALADAGAAANAGYFTIGVWKNMHGKGHVAIITSYLSLLGSKPEHHAIGAWGQYKKVGNILEKMSLSFGKAKHPSIKYAKCTIRPIF